MAQVEYSLLPIAPKGQRFIVEVRFCMPLTGDADLRFAAWTPGSYKIRDYARHVLACRGWSQEQVTPLHKIDKSTYRISAAPGTAIRVQFEMFGMDDSVRGAWLDPWRGHFEAAAVFPQCLPHADAAVALELRPPDPCPHWQVSCALAPTDAVTETGWGWYQAENWRALIDHPVLMGELRSFQYEAHGCAHEFVLAGAQELEYDQRRLARDCAAICTTQSALMGGNPNTSYKFLLRVAPSGDGGLEHQNCSLLASLADNLPQRDADQNRGYERLLGLISHEYFHLWNVKRIRPRLVAESALDSEAPFADLWAYEGVTAYLDDWFLRQSNTRSPKDYLRVLSEHLTRLEATPGRLRQSLAEASRDAWIRLYQPSPHLPLSTVSYYLKGALVAMALDLELRLRSAGQLSLIKLLAEQYRHWQSDPAPLEEHALRELALQHCPDLADFFERYIDDAQEPDYAELLHQFGLRCERRAPATAHDAGGAASAAPWRCNLGLRFARADSQNVTLVEPESPAEAAGIVAGDDLQTVNGQSATAGTLDQLLRVGKPGQEVRIGWLHDARQHEAVTHLAEAEKRCWRITLNRHCNAVQAERRAHWLALDPG